MRTLHLFTHCILLATTPLLHASPQNLFSSKATENEMKQWVRPSTYKEIMELLEELESGELEKKYSSMQLISINTFLAILANEGILSNEREKEVALREDTQDLLFGEENLFCFWNDTGEWEVHAVPLYNEYEFIPCGTISHAWKKTKNFVKDHKKEIIIGAIVVAGVTAITAAIVITSSSCAASAITGATSAASAIASNSNKSETVTYHETPILDSIIKEEISSFKDNLAREDLFQPYPNIESLSAKEIGEVISPLFAHQGYNQVYDSLSNRPALSEEIQRLGTQPNPYFSSESISSDLGHLEIDKRFASDYGHLFSGEETRTNFRALSYQLRGERALDFGYHQQAIHDFSRAIDLNPTDAIPYLERSESYFRLGDYNKCIEDFDAFSHLTIPETSTLPFSISDFSLGFAKGLPKGMGESTHGILMLLSNTLVHPINTVGQIWNSLKLLNELANSQEWAVLAEVLAPEIYQLVTEWHSIPSDTRGELAGHAFGKHGADIIIPGALAKAVARGTKGAREISAISRNLKMAEKTLLMESVAGMESGAKIAEVVQLEKKISGWLGEGAKFIKNEAGDPVFLSKDGLRCVRFDFNRTKPHHNPHAHVEIKVNGKWVKSGQIYPTDVPHN